ncbi:hypothetical protein [Tellurirhabdus bombi]|uniref:hypothetical protein n=1 Tax=Tellurirhabdus bombi TaxID=2907205 RepID=UPI001F1FE5AF|nr:hypothetical protein [Tellurirhabdus bombi]
MGYNGYSKHPLGIALKPERADYLYTTVARWSVVEEANSTILKLIFLIDQIIEENFN